MYSRLFNKAASIAFWLFMLFLLVSVFLWPELWQDSPEWARERWAE